MSYYGPALQGSAGRTSRTHRSRLSEYDYSKHREHNQAPLHRAGHFNRHNKRLRTTFRIVPWRDERELQAVGRSLLSVLEPTNDISNQVQDGQQGSLPSPTTALSPEEGFEMISVWKSRLSAPEGLPHAVESTAALAQVYWRDSQRRTQRSIRGLATIGASVSVTELRLAYSGAIIRCINGFADSLQQQRSMASSVAYLCGQLGIPTWLVDTRHESSHNALPSLEVLRLSASTLLEFMRSEYWIPRCPEWNNSNDENPATSTGVDRRIHATGEIETLNLEQNISNSGQNTNARSPIDFLLEYEACASDWSNYRAMGTNVNEEKGNNTAPSAIKKQSSKRKKKSSSGPQKTRILPYDPLFGEIGPIDSDDDDDSYGANDSCNDGNNLDKPVVNSIWGSSIGTNKNRYMLLDIPKQKKKKSTEKKKQQKSIPKSIKKRKGEKSPTDCAKLYVQSVSSLQEGYAVATQYLIWGGVGGAPRGRGVLIPESEVAFPATPQGVTNCWQRYSPLIHVISRTWPGFAAYMITDLVDCVLSTEDSFLEHENNADQCTKRQDLGEGPTRKLFFLSAWIRLLLSHRFVSALDRSLSVKGIPNKNNNPLEIHLAHSDHLECLGYPLNSLLDRCCRVNDHSRKSKDSDDNTNSNDSILYNLSSTETSKAISRTLETILSKKKTNNFGYSEATLSTQDIQRNVVPTLSEGIQENTDIPTSNTEAEICSGAMSLDEMEKMLMLDDNHDGEEESETKTERVTSNRSDKLKPSGVECPEKPFIGESEPPVRRPAWIRCKSWDACAIGTLPGYPF